MRVEDAVRIRHMIGAAEDALVHAYFDIELDILSVTVTQALPDLLAQLNSLQLPE